MKSYWDTKRMKGIINNVTNLKESFIIPISSISDLHSQNLGYKYVLIDGIIKPAKRLVHIITGL